MDKTSGFDERRHYCFDLVTKFCSTSKLEVAAKEFGLLTKVVSCIGKYGGLKAAYQTIFVLYP